MTKNIQLNEKMAILIQEDIKKWHETAKNSPFWSKKLIFTFK